MSSDLDYRIRPAIETDAAVYPAIENSAGQLFRTWPALAWVALEKDRTVSEYRDAIALGWCWTATDWDERCIGFICAMRHEAELHIMELAVDKIWQGRGIGRSLLERAMAEARAHFLSAITLTTFGDPPWNAPFYIRRGFKIIDPAQLSVRLERILTEENLRSLPRNHRCAMIFSLPDVRPAASVAGEWAIRPTVQGEVDSER